MIEPIGQVITFYSYKGGTGRSMALANSACLLAGLKPNGKCVLMIDWDLEAPGLHRFFDPKFTKHFSHAHNSKIALDQHLGLIDLFIELNAVSLSSYQGEELSEEQAEFMLSQVELERFIIETDIPGLHLLKAGRFDDSYPNRVNTFLWEDLYNRIPSLMSTLATRLANQYQYVLIDSRTGITDTSGICTMIMPEKLVVVFTPNHQSLLGLDSLIKQAIIYRKASSDLRPLIVLPLPSRTDRSELELFNSWRFGNHEMNIIGYQPLFEKLFEEVYDLHPCDLRTYFDQIELQYIPYFSYGEEIATLVETNTSRLSLSSSYEHFAEQLVSQDDPWMQNAQGEPSTYQTSISQPVNGIVIGDKANVNVVIHQFDPDKEKQRSERLQRLQALLIDSSEFMHTRLESFVGRENELAEIQECIAEKLPTGGYVTITGQAGQGKSSMIVKLVEKYGTDTVAFHFIPFNPGPDHQVSLLRNLMTRLILKHDLSEMYIASESRPALRDYFPKVLEDIADRDMKEVIFIDGLDQLEEEFNGIRDLSFLPSSLPPGVVIVLGTRPNDTLRPLELLQPHIEYQLPNLSRQDFDLILEHRKVHLGGELADQFYYALQANALYLDLVAKELRESRTSSPQEIIAQLAQNPENLFSLSINRLKRASTQWREVIKPLLGLLLAAREPLSFKHIRQILEVDDDQLKEGIERLGGLIADDGHQRYFLYHLKFQDYLRQDERFPKKKYIFATDEEEQWHSTLTTWCEKTEVSLIWENVKDPSEQERRDYARKHYISHLYRSRQWQRLFHILDEGMYGQAKMHYDPSAYFYALDLDLGRRAATWDGWTIAESIALLPHLWRYTLLRCSLTSRANQYSQEAFEALLSLGRELEALGLAELSTNTSLRVNAFMQVANYLEESSASNRKMLLLLLRTIEPTGIFKDDKIQTRALSELVSFLIEDQQRNLFKSTSHTISVNDSDAQAKIAQIAIAALSHTIEDNEVRAEALAALAPHLPHPLLEDLLRSAHSFSNKDARNEVLSELSRACVQAQQWEQASSVIGMIESRAEQIEVLRELGEALAQAHQWERAERVADTIEDSKAQTEVLSTLGLCLAQAQQWEEANVVWSRAEILALSLEKREDRAKALWELSRSLARVQQWDRLNALTHLIESDEDRSHSLSKIGGILIHARSWEETNVEWNRVETAILTMEQSHQKTEALRELGAALAQAQQWEQATRVAHFIEDIQARAEVLGTIGLCLAQAQQIEQAEVIWTELKELAFTVEDSNTRIEVMRDIARFLARNGEYEQLLYLVQKAWIQVDTRELAVKLLPLVSGLIPLKPDIGTAFYQAFEWVDAFFEEQKALS